MSIERLHTLQDNAFAASARITSETVRRMPPWLYADSRLIGPKKKYIPGERGIINTGLPFWETFAPVNPEYLNLPPQEEKEDGTMDMRLSLKNDIQKVLAKKAGNAIGLELGGPGSRLFAEFDEGFFKQTFGVDILDHRFASQKIQDQERNHSVILANIFLPEGIKVVAQNLPNKKADFIISRMGGVMQPVPEYGNYAGDQFEHGVPPSIFALGKLAADVYALLNTEGLMYIQYPNIFEPLMATYTSLLHENLPGIEIATGSYDKTTYKEGWSVMRLVKHEGAPDQLPFLRPQAIRHLMGRDAFNTYTITEADRTGWQKELLRAYIALLSPQNPDLESALIPNIDLFFRNDDTDQEWWSSWEKDMERLGKLFKGNAKTIFTSGNNLSQQQKESLQKEILSVANKFDAHPPIGFSSTEHTPTAGELRYISEHIEDVLELLVRTYVRMDGISALA